MTNKFVIAIGCDDAGFDYKEILKKDLQGSEVVIEVIDVGVDATGHTAYPRIAIAAAELVASGKADRALQLAGGGLRERRLHGPAVPHDAGARWLGALAAPHCQAGRPHRAS